MLGSFLRSLENNSLLNDFYQSEALVFGKWTSLHDFYGVADFGLVVFVMRFVLFRVLDAFMVQIMFFVGFYSHHDCFVHFVAYDFADLNFAGIAFAHVLPPSFIRDRTLLGKDSIS